ncbi:MAG: hypothetical protein M0009_05730 [Deltaproteobacteria bacterium]|nr:hypothetical protein [Deltaproteobacteria bacterium]
MERKEELPVVILSLIREGNAAGRLVRTEELRAGLEKRGLAEPAGSDPPLTLDTTLAELLRENSDLRKIAVPADNPGYYSILCMSESYAGLLAGKADSPLAQIARVVRDHSRLYPRPVPADSFGASPFDFPPETIAASLAALEKDAAYQDIGQTTTSAGTLFLYSAMYLEPDYAVQLAEWLDVGRVDNP